MNNAVTGSKRFAVQVLIALGFVTLSLVASKFLIDLDAIKSPLSILILGAVFSTWYGGMVSGITAIFLSVILSNYFYLSPLRSFSISNEQDVLRLFVFVAISGTICYLTNQKSKSEQLERTQKERFRVTISSIGDAVIVTDPDGNISMMNPVAEQLTGWSVAEAIGKNISAIFQIVNESTRQIVQNPLHRALHEGKIMGLENHTILISRSGDEIPIDDSGAPIRDDSGLILGAVLVFRDVRARRKAEAELESFNDRLRLAMDAGNMGVWDWSVETGELKWMGNLERIHGIPQGTAPKNYEDFRKLIHPDDVETFEKQIQESIKNKSNFSTEFRVIWADGTLHWVGGIGRAYYDETGAPVRMIGVGIDLTERKRSEETIALQLKQKEILLKEVHHRVKNNLQVVSSLLSLQSHQADSRLREQLLESRTRIQSMALIHEKLYQAPDLSRIDLAQYIEELARILYSMYGVDQSRVQFKIIKGGVIADIDTAIPCGLISNEIISNSLKHGFPHARKGSIQFTIQREPGAIIVEAGDDGIGIDGNISMKDCQSLGLKLIWNLVGQLKGSVKLETSSGTRYLIRIPYSPGAGG